MHKIGKAAALGVACALALGGCNWGDSDTKQSAPEPDTAAIINGTNTHVIKMPDGFRNIAFTCWDSTGVYVTSRGDWSSSTGQNASGDPLPSAMQIYPNDPHCTK